jgi:very-short-patch-repair endonuclease
LNSLLSPDGFELRVAEVRSGRPIYRVTGRGAGVAGGVKNLIFAAEGPKPDLVLTDAVSNDVQIVRNAKYCLVFTDPIPDSGLTWASLVTWWARLKGLEADSRETEAILYRRLRRSLGSKPERVLFDRYFRTWRPILVERLPALIPQVYLHYDPLTIRQRADRGILPRQRMDFLLLLSPRERVVIEVDGKQHYAEGDVASPGLYAEMVAADRDLRLLGYEVYRFGGAEFSKDRIGDALDVFFRRLFERHRRL